MLRNFGSRATSSAYAASFVRGLTVTKIQHDKSSQRQYSSSQQQSNSSSIWPNIAVGLAFGAAGFAYLMNSEENVAHCDASRNWMNRPRPGVAPSPMIEDTTILPSARSRTTQTVAPKVSKSSQSKSDDPQTEVSANVGLPSHIPYLIIGAGTAGMAAYRAIRTKEANAKVLLIGEEEYKPYMRPPLSKDMWFTEKSLIDENKFKTWSGRDRSLFFEKDSYYCEPSELATSEKGGVAVLTSSKVVKLNPSKKQAILSDGSMITYDRCLIATGGTPRNLPVFQQAGGDVMHKVSLFRNIGDFKRLHSITDTAKSVLVVGGGFLGSELACALGKVSTTNNMKVTQVFPEPGNMGRVLPAYLSNWTTDKVRSENVHVIPEVSVEKCRLSEDRKQVEVLLSNGQELSADHIVMAVGLQPNTQLAESAGLEVDEKFGGFLVNAELEAATDVWVAGDAACFYDVKLGRRRVEHHDHAVVSGRLAGENMTGASKRFLHQSMFWSDLGPDVGYEAIGLVNSDLPTVSVFAKASVSDNPAAVESKTGESLRSETEQNQIAGSSGTLVGDKFGKGVIFYMNGKKVVGVLCWNVFNKIGIARKIIKDGAEHEDLSELAKLFDLHQSAVEDTESASN